MLVVVAPFWMLVDWLTLRKPSRMLGLLRRVLRMSELMPRMESVQVRPVDAMGIVTELLTMLPLTTATPTLQPVGTLLGMVTTTWSTPGYCERPRYSRLASTPPMKTCMGMLVRLFCFCGKSLSLVASPPTPDPQRTMAWPGLAELEVVRSALLAS